MIRNLDKDFKEYFGRTVLKSLNGSTAVVQEVSCTEY